MRLQLPLTALVAALLGVSCSSAPTALAPWPAATSTIRAGANFELSALEQVVGEAFDPASPALEQALARIHALQPSARACAAGWTAMEAYCGRLLPLLESFPYEVQGVEPAVLALGAFHEELLRTHAIAADPLGDGLATQVARRMRASYSTSVACAEAELAIIPLADAIAQTHEVHVRKIAAASTFITDLLDEDARATSNRRDTLIEIVRAVEEELRMEAAGAGRARPDASEVLALHRPELTVLESRLTVLSARRAQISGACEQQRSRAQRAGFAAREWAIAHREITLALREGRPRANLSLLQASAAELGRRPTAVR